MSKSYSYQRLAEPGRRKSPFEVVIGVVLAAAWIGLIVVLLQDPGAAKERAAAAAQVVAMEPPVSHVVENVEFGPPVGELPSLALAKAPIDYDDFGPPVGELPSLTRPRSVAQDVDGEQAPVGSL